MIATFRDYNDLSITTVLTFAARGDDYNARVNSLLILANVIDNTTICVPLDHLYDRDITMNGRANLLGVVSVVAPWAYLENYNNISKVEAYTSNTLPKDDPDLNHTYQILGNIRNRLKSQTEASNRGAHLPPDLQRCKSYKPRWATPDDLKY